MRNPIRQTNAYSRGLVPVVVAICALLSSCVSSTLTPSDPEPVALASQPALSEEELQAERARVDAIAQIHDKANAVPYSEEAPEYGVRRQGETALLTPEEIAAKTAMAQAVSSADEEPDSEEDLAARQRRIELLLIKGRTHHQSAVNRIEKE